MAAWVLTRGLQTVRAELNDAFDRRDKTSDGSIGDLAHQQESASGHNPDITGAAEYRDGDSLNEVRAIDVDRDLVPGSNVDWMERVVQYLVTRARAGIHIPFQYIIYKRRIWSRTDGWKTRSYTGKNAHDEHAHFSGGRSQADDNWAGTLGLKTLIGDNDVDFSDTFTLTADAAGATGRKPQEAIQLGTALNLLLIYTAKASRNQLPALLAAAGEDQVDEPAIIAGVLAGLDPAAIAAAVTVALPADLAKKTADEIYARMKE